MAGAFQNLSDIVIKSSFGSYQIEFSPMNSQNFVNSYFLVDEKLRDRIKVDLEKSIFVSAEESKKTLSSVENILIKLSDQGMKKNHELVVIGGGFLQDIGTLVASLYMRGVNWIYVPTTLASMGDSSIGGKSSINAGHIKNLLGNFYPPKKVLVDISFVSTLPDLELVAGISEIIKICYAKSFFTFNECSELLNEWRIDSNLSSLTKVIQLSLRSKKYFVEEDEFDLGIRKLLNFGHSFGHALESASEYKIPHGVAVLFGMIAAVHHPLSDTSEETKLLTATCLSYCKAVSKEMEGKIEAIDYSIFSAAIAKDKKNTNSDLVLILPKSNTLEIVRHPFSENSVEVATVAMKSGMEVILNEVC